jgi:transposase
MMGEQKSEPQLFNYAVNLEKRVRASHPLRRVKELIGFGFVREEVAHCYGRNGNESVPPEVILKMMFLLFFDDIKSERELMEVIGERLDYLWFLDYGLDEKVPDHSVLSKARARWGKEVFESLFVRTVAQCVEAGLVDGGKLHVDASLVDADAAKESVIKGASELIAILKRAYRATESKLEETSTPGNYHAVNDRMMSQSDPDAACVRKGSRDSRFIGSRLRGGTVFRSFYSIDFRKKEPWPKRFIRLCSSSISPSCQPWPSYCVTACVRPNQRWQRSGLSKSSSAPFSAAAIVI